MSTTQTDRPTATYPAGYPLATYTSRTLPEGWRVDPAGYLPGPLAASTGGAAAAARLQEADATPTQVFPARPLAGQRQALFPEASPALPEHGGAAAPADAAFIARTGARVCVGARGRARVYHAPSTKGRRSARSRTERRRELVRRHLKSAMAAIALAAAILSVLQAYAASGITEARQAALQSAREGAGAHAYSTPSDGAPSTDPSRTGRTTPRTEGAGQPAMSGQTHASATMSDRTSAAPMSGQTASPSDWVAQDTGAPFDRTNPHASPLTELPRCTTAPDTPLPCLAHVSANSDRVVILEDDGSLTALVRR